MVEVNPGKGEINVQVGWMIFTAVAVVVFAVIFAYLPPAGWNYYGFGAAVLMAALVDLFYFGAPPLFLLLVMMLCTLAVLVKIYLF
jgi:hypothetical protein